MTITRGEVESLMLSACPSFTDNADRHEWHKDWDSDPDHEPPLFLLVADFIRHIARLNAEGNRDEFDAVFAVIDDLLRYGDDYVKDLATVGFLEDLQHTNLHPEGSRPEDFIPYLRPLSRWWWEEVQLFWEGNAIPIGSSGRPRPE